MERITIPYSPRPQQLGFHARIEQYRFYVAVCHRRWGKTVAAVNELLKRTFKCELDHARGVYLAPLHKQAKAIAWDYLKLYTKPIPGIKVNESELRVDFPNRARVQLAGADNFLALKGQYFDYAICDEFAQWAPGAWSEAIRPALADRQGGACFIGTPRGHNEFYTLWERVEELPDWGREIHRASESGVLPQSELEALARELTDEEYAQELEVSWEAAIRGAFYGKAMATMESEGRVKSVLYDDRLLVQTSWDLGASRLAPTNCVGFWQVHGSEVRLIEVWEDELIGFEDLAKRLRSRPYSYGKHFAPHDIEVGDLSTGTTRLEVARNYGIHFTVSRKVNLSDGINATRSMLKRTYIDRTRTSNVVEGLKQYRTDFDDKNKAFRSTPLHDWSSHLADMCRYFAINENRCDNEADYDDLDYSEMDRLAV